MPDFGLFGKSGLCMWYSMVCKYFFGPNYNRNTSKLWCKFSSFNM